MKSKLIQGFLSVIVLSFLLWSATNVLWYDNQESVIKVNKYSLSATEWQQILIRNSIFSDSLNNKEIKIKKTQLLQQVIDKLTLYEASLDSGIVITNNMVRQEVLNIPSFKRDGIFNRVVFHDVLRRHGLNEEQFIKEVKLLLSVRFFIKPFQDNILILSSLKDFLFKNLLDKKLVEILEFPLASFNIKYTKVKESVSLDKKRKTITFHNTKVRYISMSSHEVKKYHSKTLIKDIYNKNTSVFKTKEIRVISQIQCKSMKDAEVITEDIKNGKDFINLDNVYVNKFTKDDFDKEVSKIIFRLSNQEFSPPIITSLGIKIFKINDILTPKIKSFIEVQNYIKKEYIKNELNKDKIFFITKLQDAIRSNVSLKKLSKRYGFGIAEQFQHIPQHIYSSLYDGNLQLFPIRQKLHLNIISYRQADINNENMYNCTKHTDRLLTKIPLTITRYGIYCYNQDSMLITNNKLVKKQRLYLYNRYDVTSLSQRLHKTILMNRICSYIDKEKNIIYFIKVLKNIIPEVQDLNSSFKLHNNKLVNTEHSTIITSIINKLKKQAKIHVNEQLI